MATGYEVKMYQNIERIAKALERIASALELHEERIGYEACWITDGQSRHCRKPKDHQGPHAYA